MRRVNHGCHSQIWYIRLSRCYWFIRSQLNLVYFLSLLKFCTFFNLQGHETNALHIQNTFLFGKLNDYTIPKWRNNHCSFIGYKEQLWNAILVYPTKERISERMSSLTWGWNALFGSQEWLALPPRQLQEIVWSTCSLATQFKGISYLGYLDRLL